MSSAAVALVSVLAAPLLLAGGSGATADAAVVYSRVSDGAIVVASDDGSGARVIGHGSGPVVSPDGRRVVFQRPGGAVVADLGGRARRLVPLGVPYAWSADGRVLVGMAGEPRGSGDHQVIDFVEGRSGRVVARIHLPYPYYDGPYEGTAFSATGSRALVSSYFSDVAQEQKVVDRHGRVIGHRSFHELPAWGRHGLAYETTDEGRDYQGTYRTITYRPRLTGPSRVLMRTDPRDLEAVGWSSDGRTLLVARPTADPADPGQPSSLGEEAVLVDRVTGTTRVLPRAFDYGAPSYKHSIVALSRDGQVVLGVSQGQLIAEHVDGTVEIISDQPVESATWSR